MGSGIQASDLPPELKKALEDMRDQLLIVLIKRAGGKVDIPVGEIDCTGQDLLGMQFNQVNRTFTFIVQKKS